jgi:hypothetical protein
MYSTYSTRNRNRRRYESSEDLLVYSELESSFNRNKAAKEVAAKLGRTENSVISRYWYMKYNRIVPFKEVNETAKNVDLDNIETPSKITFNIKGVEVTIVFKQDV